MIDYSKPIDAYLVTESRVPKIVYKISPPVSFLLTQIVRHRRRLLIKQNGKVYRVSVNTFCKRATGPEVWVYF